MELQLVAKIGSGEFGDVYKAKWHGSFVSGDVLCWCLCTELMYKAEWLAWSSSWWPKIGSGESGDVYKAKWHSSFVSEAVLSYQVQS